jgi:hypothetical protein
MRRLVMFALAGTLAACSIDSTGPNGSVDRQLHAAQDQRTVLPYTFSGGLRLMSDELTLMSDGTYEDISRYDDASTYDDGRLHELRRRHHLLLDEWSDLPGLGDPGRADADRQRLHPGLRARLTRRSRPASKRALDSTTPHRQLSAG